MAQAKRKARSATAAAKPPRKKSKGATKLPDLPTEVIFKIIEFRLEDAFDATLHYQVTKDLANARQLGLLRAKEFLSTIRCLSLLNKHIFYVIKSPALQHVKKWASLYEETSIAMHQHMFEDHCSQCSAPSWTSLCPRLTELRTQNIVFWQLHKRRKDIEGVLEQLHEIYYRCSGGKNNARRSRRLHRFGEKVDNKSNSGKAAMQV